MYTVITIIMKKDQNMMGAMLSILQDKLFQGNDPS